ncbi:SpoIID/LytB domain-containing protein [Nocardioides piscis]|uniref:SpoIID/LytB domain-containing protein n=1 Tax=Nocardioides piscis TaxID=2714938 RepID=A0A6G7YFH2_9ACTN|nr:SpoIID/LytB domain-containing protein [Nocardioides piscis]QIK75555.1 SpoIID/LytB domain-containing protein [Nocardioides piscis]
MRRLVQPWLAVVLALLVATSMSPSASASRAGEAYAVAGPSTITLTGHGYGHGHGMSQYGAEGAARAGLTWQQIIDFYYPGTSWGEHRGSIKVWITGDTSDDVAVSARSGLKVTRLAPRKTWTLPANGAKQWRINGLSGGRSQLQFRKSGSWRTWKAFRGSGQFSSANNKLTLRTPAGPKTYRGRLRSALVTPGGAARDTVNVLSLESYLRGVVPLEIPALWSADAVRAQSVAARTYAAKERADRRGSHYQICDTTACQVYGGFDVEHPAATQAIQDTARQGLFYEGEPAFTQFSSSNGGFSSAGSVPYLVAKEDPYDGWSGNTNHTWAVTLSDRDFEKHYPQIGDLTSIEVVERDGNGDWGGRVEDMTLVGSRSRVALSGDTLRSLMGLKSSWFTFSVAPLQARNSAARDR